jgi:hypothetical protein
MTTAHGKPKENWIRAVRIIQDIPLENYRKKTDGRQWKHLAEQRQRLMWLLAGKADPDGTNIKISVEKIMEILGWSHGKVFEILDDLEEMGLIHNGGYSEYHGTRLRWIDSDWLKLQRHLSVVYRNNWKLKKALLKVNLWADEEGIHSSHE